LAAIFNSGNIQLIVFGASSDGYFTGAFIGCGGGGRVMVTAGFGPRRPDQHLR